MKHEWMVQSAGNYLGPEQPIESFVFLSWWAFKSLASLWLGHEMKCDLFCNLVGDVGHWVTNTENIGRVLHSLHWHALALTLIIEITLAKKIKKQAAQKVN